MSAEERGEAPKLKWFQQWWGILALAIAGSVLPQLCALIPNVVGSAICNTVVKVAVVAVGGAPTANAVQPPPLVPVEVCPEERRLSTGKCLPPP